MLYREWKPLEQQSSPDATSSPFDRCHFGLVVHPEADPVTDVVGCLGFAVPDHSAVVNAFREELHQGLLRKRRLVDTAEG